jgi:hypothetical protein
VGIGKLLEAVWKWIYFKGERVFFTPKAHGKLGTTVFAEATKTLTLYYNADSFKSLKRAWEWKQQSFSTAFHLNGMQLLKMKAEQDGSPTANCSTWQSPLPSPI